MVAKPLRVVCYVPTFNAGDTTRGIEVARALRDRSSVAERETDITFVCPPIAGFNFEHLIKRAGFKVEHTAVPLDAATIANFMNADRTGEEFIPEYDRAKLYVAKYMEDLRMRRPDLVVNGCIPPAGIAARILNIPTVTYLPFPGYKPWVERHLIKSLPDDLENGLTTRLPAFARRRLVAAISPLATRKRFFTQPTLARAGRELGWREPEPNLFSMLKADVELVTDVADFYAGQNTGPRARFTGPLYSHPPTVSIDPRILEIFRPENPAKILVTMGSSGEKKYFLEAVRAVANTEYNSVVVVQPTICTMAEVRESVRVPPSMYLTDQFIPAHQINPLADVAVIHGGQGTVQTTLASGTPFVGVAMQAEQQANLDNPALRGAGLRIGRKFWRAENIDRALRRILSTPAFKINAMNLAKNFGASLGHRAVGEAIWEMVEARQL